MKLLFKQRLFAWLDSYDIYDENQNTVFTVKGVLALKHCFKIYDANSNEVGVIRERVLTFFCPRFDLIIDGAEAGSIVKEFTFFKPKFTMDFRNWQIEGDWLKWNYQIRSPEGAVAVITKQVFNWTDTYAIDIPNPQDALAALMVVIAIDAVKCTQKKSS